MNIWFDIGWDVLPFPFLSLCLPEKKLPGRRALPGILIPCSLNVSLVLRAEKGAVQDREVPTTTVSRRFLDPGKTRQKSGMDFQHNMEGEGKGGVDVGIRRALEQKFSFCFSGFQPWLYFLPVVVRREHFMIQGPWLGLLRSHSFPTTWHLGSFLSGCGRWEMGLGSPFFSRIQSPFSSFQILWL